MFRLGCAVILVLTFAIPALAAHYLPAWAVVLVLIAEVFLLLRAIPALLKYGFKRFFFRIFFTKSRVLKRATVVVHEVRLTPRPARRLQLGSPSQSPDQPRTEVVAADGTVLTTPAHPHEEDTQPDDKEEQEETEPNTGSIDDRFVLVDFTLTPAPSTGMMQYYEPAELLLVPIDAKISFSQDPTSDGLSATAHDLTLVENSGAQTKDFDKLTGPAHLRVVFRCPPPLRGRVKFRYFFESFGDLTLPENDEC